MKQSKTHLKKSQERTIKLIGVFLAVILLVTFVLSSSSMNLSASITRPSVRTETVRPTKPAIPALTCKTKCGQSMQICMLSKEGPKTCSIAYDRCVSACPR